jgi:aminoglycoside phosphotransferase (APT) family kinase protein
MARDAMHALAGIHKVDPAKAPYLGEYWGFEFDVTRWDRFYDRAAEQELLALQPRVKQLLLDNIPHEARIGIFPRRLPVVELALRRDATLLAVIDWELCGIGPALNDVGWICAFSDPSAWVRAVESRMPLGDDLEAWYRDAYGDVEGNLNWFKALAMYKFAIISGFNLMLHRRGKRDDPHWEDIKPSMKTNMEYALRMLTS